MLSNGGVTNMSVSETIVQSSDTTTFSVISDVCSVGMLNTLIEVSWAFGVFGALCMIGGIGLGMVGSAWYIKSSITLLKEETLKEVLRRSRISEDK